MAASPLQRAHDVNEPAHLHREVGLDAVAQQRGEARELARRARAVEHAVDAAPATAHLVDE
jgi:hypothetical protein